MGGGGSPGTTGGGTASFGSGGLFSEVGDRILPRGDGTDPNDWVGDVHPPRFAAWRPTQGALASKERFVQVWWNIAIDSASGSNTWTVELVCIPNSFDHWDDWEVFTAPHGPHGIGHPIKIDNADLPLDYLATVPVSLGPWALKFTRSGAGTNGLRVRTWMDAP